MIENKKGAEFTISTLIFIVLGVIVLVILVLGFTMGWGNLWGNIQSFFGAGDVKSVVQACQVSATVENGYDFCLKLRTVKFTDKKEYVTCLEPRIKNELGEDIMNCEASTINLQSAAKVCESHIKSMGDSKKTEACNQKIYFTTGSQTCKEILKLHGETEAQGNLCMGIE